MECMSKLHIKFLSKEGKLCMQFRISNEFMLYFDGNLDSVIVFNSFSLFIIYALNIVMKVRKNILAKNTKK